MGTHIFISYAKKDTKLLAMDLAEKLKNIEGVSAWVDVEGIDYGDEWETLIQRQIARCDYMVVLYSPDINRHIDDESQTESYVIKEIRYAQMRKKPIIPVMAQETEPPMGLISIQYIDYANEGISSAELVNRLCKRMKINFVSQPVATSVTAQIATPPKPKIILPQPFDWCYIPAGKVTLTPDAIDNNIYIKRNTVVDVPAFWMAKYPITNAQYREFVLDGGPKSGYSDDTEWNKDDYPVVGVSWYHAMKFCRWFSNKIGQNITLPTDAQWQRSAQGDDERQFPWGNTWDGSFCNNNVYEKGIGKTTPVKRYEGVGDSPFGVVDMSGNVWEWCLTTYKTGENQLESTDIYWRILRGGSWHIKKKEMFSTIFRVGDDTVIRLNDEGFRVICISSN